jgi:hypothetical protein
MGGSSGSSKTTNTTKVELPKWYEGYAQQAAGMAANQLNQPYQQYPGTRVTPLTSQQTQGLQMTQDRATQGSPLIDAAQQNATSTLQGDYLDPSTNPAWASGSKAITDAYRTGTAATRNAAFSKANAFGSDNSAFNQYAGMQDEGLGNSLGSLWGSLYNSERDNQFKASALAPGLASQDYADAQALIGAGDAYRQYNQDVANVGYEDWYNQQMWPQNQVNWFSSVAPGLIGNSGSTTQTGPNPNQASPLAGAIGGGALGYGAGALAGFNPLLGAGLGALGGLIFS